MGTADKLRYFTNRSNQLHRQYLADPEFLKRYERFVTWQISYMLPFYKELRLREDTKTAIDFVVSDLAGTEISERDLEIQRVVPAMIRILPGKALRTIASGMEMNARILELNLSIYKTYHRQNNDATIYTEKKYCIAAREATSLGECIELISLTKQLGYDLERIVRIPLIGLSLKAMRKPASLAGFSSLQLFLEKGYSAFSKLDSVDQFLRTTETKMRQMFEHIYLSPLPNID